MTRMGSEGRRRYLLLVCLGIVSIAAVLISYLPISHFRTGVIGYLACGDGGASLKLVSREGSVTVYYVSVVEGDNVAELRKIGYRLDGERALTIRLRPPPGSRVSVLMDKGVIPGLACNESGISQP